MAKHQIDENYNNTFRVENGMMITRYDQYEKFEGEFGHIFYNTPFSHYKLRVEYRVVGEQVHGGAGWAMKNSGVMFHAQSPQSMLLDQDFPVSIEAQFLGGLGDGERPTGNLCTPGTHVVIMENSLPRHCTNSSSPTFHGEEWVTFELEVHGDSIIHHLINGDTVMTYSKPQVGGDSARRLSFSRGNSHHFRIHRPSGRKSPLRVPESRASGPVEVIFSGVLNRLLE